jgi:hypothetical protein
VDLLQTILNSQGGQTVDQLGQHVGLDRDQTVSALQSLLPALAGGLANNVAKPGGLDGLLSALTSGSHQRYIDNPASVAHPDAIEDGNGILGHVLGSKDASRQVAAQASAQTGIGADILKKMLPMVATLAMGAISHRAANQQSFGTAPAGSAGGGLMDMLGTLLRR